MPKTVLIADDDALFRAAMGDGLRAAGYHVVTAEDGLEALGQVRKGAPDYILLDLIMPKLDGFRLCKMLKAHAQYRTIPIVLLTGAAKEGFKSLNDLGAEAAVAKRGAEATLTQIRNTLQLLQSARLRPSFVADSAPDLEERRIVSELLAERQHTQAMLANLGEGVVELDGRGQVVYANPAALRVLDSTEVQLLGSPGAQLLGGANAPALQRGMGEVQRRGDGYPLRLELLHGERTLGVTLTALPQPDTSPGILFVLRDLPDRDRRARNL